MYHPATSTHEEMISYNPNCSMVEVAPKVYFDAELCDHVTLSLVWGMYASYCFLQSLLTSRKGVLYYYSRHLQCSRENQDCVSTNGGDFQNPNANDETECKRCFLHLQCHQEGGVARQSICPPKKQEGISNSRNVRDSEFLES